MCTTVLGEHGPIDVLVNNVGGRRENIATEDMPLEPGGGSFDLNLTAPFVCTKLIGGAMLPRKWGRVINIASICGQIATRGIFGRHYETAKAAVVGFTRAVAADWAPHGGHRQRHCSRRLHDRRQPPLVRERPELMKEVEGQVPMGRLGEPDEIGPLAVYLASEASGYMTGATLVIDGGYTVW